jgi:cyclopropane fatty-acyl-phospholipid synthase-like methyltransferase
MNKEQIVDQATRPSGWKGRLMGELMAATNRPRNRWLIEQLELRPGLSGMEFGFGNGETLTAFLQRSEGGRATGIDWSLSMIDSARSRNAAFVNADRLHLRVGDIADRATDIGGPYDRIWSSNVIQMIADRQGLFGRLHAALSDDGLLAICFQPRGPSAPDPKELAQACLDDLAVVGFTGPELRWMPHAKPAAFCIVASR